MSKEEKTIVIRAGTKALENIQVKESVGKVIVKKAAEK